MKLTDFCILFGILLIGIFISNDMKLNVMNKALTSQILLNKNMDEIIVDGLNAGFTGVDENDNLNVDLEAASSRIFEELSILFYGKNDMTAMAKKYVKCLIYVDENGYFTYDAGCWSDKMAFSHDATHSDKVEIVSKLIEESTDAVSLISYNDGENYKNTIDDNTMIIVYCGYDFMTSEFVYKKSYISAACIKER